MEGLIIVVQWSLKALHLRAIARQMICRVHGQEGGHPRLLRCPGWPKKLANANLQKLNKNVLSAYHHTILWKG